MFNVTDKDYQIVENPNNPLQGVKLTTGTWKDVIVVYGQVGVKESPELDIATLSFNFNIQDPAEHDFDALQEDEAFKNYLGSILQYIITDSLDYAKANNLSAIGIGNGESITDSHTESSTK